MLLWCLGLRGKSSKKHNNKPKSNSESDLSKKKTFQGKCFKLYLPDPKYSSKKAKKKTTQTSTSHPWSQVQSRGELQKDFSAEPS